MVVSSSDLTIELSSGRAPLVVQCEQEGAEHTAVEEMSLPVQTV